MNLTGRPPVQKPETRAVDPQRLALVRALPCVICGAPPPSDAHHCFHDRHGSRKTGDDETIPLCKRHHQDGPAAIHNAKAMWRRWHGPDHSYLPLVDKMLAR